MLFLCPSVGSHPQDTVSWIFPASVQSFGNRLLHCGSSLRSETWQIICSCMGSSPQATAWSLLPYGVSPVCHRTGCLTVIFLMGYRGNSALLLKCLLPFFLLSPGCDRAVSHISLTHCCAALFSQRCCRHSSQCPEKGGLEPAGTVCVWQRSPLYPPLPMPGHLHPTHCASESVPHTHLGIWEFTRNHVDWGTWKGKCTSPDSMSHKGIELRQLLNLYGISHGKTGWLILFINICCKFSILRTHCFLHHTKSRKISKS